MVVVCVSFCPFAENPLLGEFRCYHTKIIWEWPHEASCFHCDMLPKDGIFSIELCSTLANVSVLVQRQLRCYEASNCSAIFLHVHYSKSACSVQTGCVLFGYLVVLLSLLSI